jgi:hypothetical protein
MKRKMMTMLAAAMMMTAASAQESERIDRGEVLTLYSNVEKTDSLYNFWNTYVQIHPKDEVAWRNLFEVSEKKIFNMVSATKDWNGGEQLRKQLNVVGRMEKAIPGTYTFYYSAYEGCYLPEEEEKLYKEHDMLTLYAHHDEYADSAIATLPANALAGDYERWIQHLIPKGDTVRINCLLKRLYESGQYPEETLQYHFNELQGMETGAVYCGAHEGDIIGKLILQRVLGVHQDKVLYDENAAMDPEYVKDVFAQIGIPFDKAWYQQGYEDQIEKQRAIMRYIFDHSKRPVYLSAHNMQGYVLGYGLPDELKARLYNEGLTIRYSTKPYDNMAVKRRNIEQRYRLEYLRMPFHPKMKDTQLFSFSAEAYAMNYIRLLHDQLPYYKKHNRERYQWLHDIFTDIIERLEKENYDVDEFKAYLK